MRRRLVLVIASAVWLGLTQVASAQLAGVQPVVEVGQQLLQTTITAVESVLQTANQLLELTPVDEIILSGEFVTTVDEISTLITEATGLAYDISSLQSQITALFDLETAPDSMAGLKARLYEIRRVSYEAHVTALRTQTLIRTTLSALQHLTRLIDTIGGWLGNMQGNQTAAQLQGTLVEILAKIQVQQATYDRSRSVEHISELMTIESLYKIQEQIMADHPRR
jgi:hypothetical protein